VLPETLLDGDIGPIMARRWHSQAIGAADVVLVAEAAGIVAGFIAVSDGPSAYIDNLHVEHSLQSQGTGRKLLDEAARLLLARGQPAAHLHVVAANLRARSLYVRLGGVPAGIEEKDLYGTIVPNERIEWADLAVLRDKVKALAPTGRPG